MLIGGVLLGAGMELNLAPSAYRDGDATLNFTIECIVEIRHEQGDDWVVLTGIQRPTPTSPWRHRRLQVRVTALRHSFVLGVA